MQYSVVHLRYSFTQEWEQDLFEQALCDIGFEVFDGENAYIQTSVLEDNQEVIEDLIADTEGVFLFQTSSSRTYTPIIPKMGKIVRLFFIFFHFF